MRFATRLVAGTLLVLVLTVAVLVGSAGRALRDELRLDARRALEREARLLREALPADSARWADAARLAEADAHTLVILGADARVRVASARAGLRAGERVDAADLRAARTDGTGSMVAPSADGAEALFVTVAAPPLGFVRLGMPLAEVDATVHRAQRAVLGAAALALLLGALVAFVAGRSVARPLSDIAAAADAIAAGAPPRFPLSGVPEIDALVRSLRQMHGQLGDRFEALRAEQAESDALVEAMVEGVIAADGRGRITTANGAARRLLGYGDGAPLPLLPQLFRVKAAREAVDAVMRGEAVQDRLVEIDGRTFSLNARALPEGGSLLVLHDETAIKRLEAVRRDFVANVSHELKTPLTSISGYTETLLADPEDAETRQRFLGVILSNARRMQRLVDDLLDLARIESGRWQAQPEPTDVGEIGLEAWDTLADRARERGVRFAMDVRTGASVVHADTDALRQVLTNLYDNALRYTPSGGLITLSAHAEEGGVTVTVRDTGAGIGGEHLPRIFERFYRADPSRSRHEGGTGLGLAIVKHLIEGHGGRVAVESELGRGTAVRCWFPNAPVEPEERAAATGPAPERIPA
ncbi:MAG: ATP-binding protein [Gemmatimonadales bacterium]|nr:ATP-binding protein [Gemmatimonadales bacterium]